MNVNENELPEYAELIGEKFLPDIRGKLQKTMAKTPHGCGGCAHSEWVSSDSRFLGFFAVGVCRQGIKLESIQATGDFEGMPTSWLIAGYCPAVYCTAQNAGIEASSS